MTEGLNHCVECKYYKGSWFGLPNCTHPENYFVRVDVVTGKAKKQFDYGLYDFRDYGCKGGLFEKETQ